MLRTSAQHLDKKYIYFSNDDYVNINIVSSASYWVKES